MGTLSRRKNTYNFRLAYTFFRGACLALVLLMVIPVGKTATAEVSHDRLGALNGYPNYKVATIMVTFSDNPTKPKIPSTTTAWTKEYVKSVMFDAADSMAAYYHEVSGGRVTITGDVYDHAGAWYTIDRPAPSNGTCDWTSFFSDAVNAANADIDYTQYNTVFVVSPSLSCSTGGYASKTAVPDGITEQYRAASLAGMIGAVAHHEMGHIIGLNHANFWKCTQPNVIYGDDCHSVEYGDPYSVMDINPRMYYPAADHRERLGWLTSNEITTVTSDGDYVINNYENTAAVPKVLKVPQEYDPATGEVTGWYYLEYRQMVSYDNQSRTPSNDDLGTTNGVLVHFNPVTNNTYIKTQLLDMTPGSLSTNDQLDAALQVGSIYTDAQTGVSFTPLSRTADTITVRVQIGNPIVCQLAPPIVSVDKWSRDAVRGQRLTYTISVKNDAPFCGPRTFFLKELKKPKNWKVYIDGKSSGQVTLLPGQTKRFNVRIFSPRLATFGGRYFRFEASMFDYPQLKNSVLVRYVVKRK